MINYYYQLPPGTTFFGEPVQYLAQYGFHNANSEDRDKHIHVCAWAMAEHVWLENANGVVEIKRNGRSLPDHVLKHANPIEFIMVKLRAKIL